MPKAGPTLAKLTRPRLHQAVARERLFARLDRGHEQKSALCIVGPPGAGKTTLVATWLRHAGAPTLWLQLDAADADPATFMQSLDALWAGLVTSPLNLPALRADDLADLAG